MDSYDVRDVFTPTKPAQLTFVEREAINDKLVNALRTPGKQIVVYGHSGSGKSTLLINKLNQLYDRHITTRCISGLSFDQLILDAFDQLGNYFDAEKLGSSVKTSGASIQAEYFGIKSQINASLTEKKQVKQHRLLPPQLTPQTLARLMGEARCCWILEDFHKINENEKSRLSQTMKVFMDMAVDHKELKIAAIGAVGTAREVIRYDSEMRNRVAEISVPLMSDEEINEILRKGEKLLNILIPPSLKAQIVKYSNGLASICHQLALNMCFVAGVNETMTVALTLKQENLDDALTQYIEDESDTTKEAFDKALRQKKAQRYNNGKLILEALAKLDVGDGATRGELMHLIRNEYKEYPEGNLTIYLRELQTSERGSIIRFDDVSGKYSFINPFHRVFAHAVFERDRKNKTGELDFFTDQFIQNRQEINKAFEEMIKGMLIRLQRPNPDK